MSIEMPDFQPSCPVADISAYLDGELSAHVEMELEIHLASCGACTRELNEQKSLLLALESTLDEPHFDLPKDFSKAIVVNAESRVSGLRRPKERWIALVTLFGLLLVLLFALGDSAGASFAVFISGFQAFLTVMQTAVHFLFDVSLGTLVILKSLFSNFVFGSPLLALLFAAAFFGILFIFSRLLSRQSGA